jgi:hypothetical protein
MSRPAVVLVGGVGKLPYAGASFYYLHYARGLIELGYEVVYVERQGRTNEYYDPSTRAMTNDLSYALGYLPDVLAQFGVDHWALVDLEGKCHGAGEKAMTRALDRADFVLTVADPTWFEELERCERRAYVDGDPLFTQAAMVSGAGARGEAPLHYPILFTYGTRIGATDCTVPSAGRDWIPTRPVVATSLWGTSPPANELPITALLHWAAGSEVSVDGHVYGHKDRELERVIDLPRLSHRRFVLAVGGKRAPREKLEAHGWKLADPLASTRTLDAFRRFIADSYADLGIAKHAYVASRSGWFSDRSTCFLAAGRPVLHQDTGCGDWLPTGEGVLLFSGPEDCLEALERLEADYGRHAQAARRIAEDHFEAKTVIGRMLDDAGFR